MTLLNSKLTEQLLEQLATLSKLEITEAEKPELLSGLEQMIAYVDKLTGLSTDDTAALTHFPEFLQETGPDTVAALRPDVPQSFPCPEQLLSAAPRQEGSYYVVPNPIEHN